MKIMKMPFYYTGEDGFWHLLAEIEFPIPSPETDEEIEALEE